ncbi:MAG: UbiA prenyltransferase family protein [Thermodesulfobacteriota bacterium]
MEKIIALARLARPHQYLKNGFLWLPLFFGNKLLDVQALAMTLWGFLAFCAAASSIYVINDLRDVEEDRRHPLKKFRPIASFAVKRFEAVGFFFLLLLLTGIISLVCLPREFFWVTGGYVLLNLGYSAGLKHLAIIDIICIAIGFVLRILAGGFASGVRISPWIIMMTFLLALFLALAKRRDDLLLEMAGNNTRKSLDGYNLEFVSLSMGVMASVIIVAYLLYTVSPEIIAKHGTSHMYLTAFWVIFGLLRYLQITFVEQRSGSPTLILLRDFVLQAVIICWLVNVYILLYRFKHP